MMMMRLANGEMSLFGNSNVRRLTSIRIVGRIIDKHPSPRQWTRPRATFARSRLIRAAAKVVKATTELVPAIQFRSQPRPIRAPATFLADLIRPLKGAASKWKQGPRADLKTRAAEADSNVPLASRKVAPDLGNLPSPSSSGPRPLSGRRSRLINGT